MSEGRAGKGRPRGVPNKVTTALKEAILAAATQHGECGNGTGGLQGYLLKVAREDVKAFSGLLGRVLPLDVNHKGQLRVEAIAVQFVEPADQAEDG
jgi:hypothetical protein